jgi:hypothetical protein
LQRLAGPGQVARRIEFTVVRFLLAPFPLQGTDLVPGPNAWWVTCGARLTSAAPNLPLVARDHRDVVVASHATPRTRRTPCSVCIAEIAAEPGQVALPVQALLRLPTRFRTRTGAAA